LAVVAGMKKLNDHAEPTKSNAKFIFQIYISSMPGILVLFMLTYFQRINLQKQ